jgi:RimJ/RimL family protein N-acetyltransferase
MKVELRRWKIEDKEALSNLANNIKIASYLRETFPHPYSLQDAAIWLHSQENNKQADNFAIETEDQLAGGCGLLLKNDVYRLSVEIGYWVGEPFWGKGIATEAIRQLVVYCRQTYPEIIRMYAEVFANNKASMRVLEKNGFSYEGTRKKAVFKNNRVLDDQVWVLFLDK